MMKSAYPFSLTTAIILSIFILSGCAGGGKKETLHISQQTEEEKLAAEQSALEAQQLAQYMPVITQLVEQARLENPETTALEQLSALSRDSTVPAYIQGQAALQHAELLFEFDRPDAVGNCERQLNIWSDHPFAPQTRLYLAQQWVILENSEAAISELTAALASKAITMDTVENIIQTALPLLSQISDQSALTWMLAVSLHDVAKREQWLQQAAKHASLEDALQFRQSDHPLVPEQANFYKYVAKQHLMIGDYHAVRLIAKILLLDMPDSEAASVVKTWAENEGQATTIGVLLPLSGKYARYGQQALEGIRLALNRPEFDATITLRIADTAGETKQAVAAYNQLIAQGAEWIVGPLLSDNTAALVPFLSENVPVISLANQTQIAADSPYLYIHSLAKTVQADFMAHYALSQGKTRMLIIHDYDNSSREEAAAFAQTYIDAGGELIDVIELEEGVYDNRPSLVEMRSRTDDEELLASLSEDLQLFSPEQEMDIKLPLSFDAIYIAAAGKTLSVLAGQMAYSDISNVQLYGSYRWFDGHLMDDNGRYLNSAQFATPITSLAQPEQAILDVQSQYRVIWAENNEISPLFSLAYDAVLNIASLGSRLGLTGSDAIEALNSTEFSGISGNYFFDEKGIGQKTFAIQTIHNNRIETVQIVK